MADYAHEYTDKQLEALEKRFQAVYKQAEKEVTKKLEDYLKKFEEKDKIKRKLLAEGKISEEDYKNWRYGQMMTGKRWKEMRDKLAQDYTNANQNAIDAMNRRLPDVFAENTNYSTYEIENGLHVDTSFTMYDRQTVDRLLRDNPELLPQPSVDIPKDLRWNRQKIQGAIEQGILQGESIPKIAKRLRDVTDMNKAAATRNARTAMTGAQNGGRIESYKRAESLGIKMKMTWVATMDSRVRHEHAMLDGQTVDIHKPFKIAGQEIKFPGDPTAPGYLVWNCRCTTIAQLEGFEHDISKGRFSKLGDMSYEEWKEYHRSKLGRAQTETPVKQRIQDAKSVKDIEQIMNSSGWFYKNCSFDGVDFAASQSIARQFENIFEKFPKLKGQFPGITSNKEIPNGTYARCFTYDDGRIEINPSERYFGNFKNGIMQRYKEDMYFGFHPKGTTGEAVPVHEFGHALDGFLGRKLNSGGEDTISGAARKTVMKKAGYSMKSIEKNVSGYASKNPQEWFAECFAEYMTSETPRDIAMEFGAYLNELMEMI